VTVTKVGIVSTRGRHGVQVAAAIEARGLPVVSLSEDGSFAELADCDLVIECVPDDPGRKQGLLRRIESHISLGAVLASDVPARRLPDLADAVERPEQLLTLHFFDSIPETTHVELAATADTAPGALMAAQAFCRSLGWAAISAAADAAE